MLIIPAREQTHDTIDDEGFWSVVRQTLTQVLGRADVDLKVAREQLEARPIEERVLFYHVEPLDVAAQIAGTTPTTDQVKAYLTLRAKL